MSFPRYPEYKDSGVEWLGEVPGHWEVSPIKRLIRKVESGTSVNASDEPAEDGKYGVLKTSCVYTGTFDPDENKTVLAEDIHRVMCSVKAGTLIVSRMNTPDLIGAAGFVANDRHDLFLPDRLWQISFSTADARFVHFWTLTSLYRGQVKAVCTGTSPSMKNLGQDQFGSFNFATPPLPEQTQIAAFLDRETAKIDALVAEQRRLMALLKEKRQAVISHVVTQGLNPDAPMKPSDNKWLGEVPEHWIVCCLKHIKAEVKNAFVDGPFGSNLKSEHFIDDGDVYVIESNFATQGRIDTVSLKTISNEHFATINRSETRGGDIVIAKIGAQYGKASILPVLDKPAVVSGNSLKLTINQTLCDVKFVNWHLANLKELGVMEDIVNATAQPALSLGEMNNLPMLVPPRGEQVVIIQFLDEKLGEFDTLTTEAQRAIDLLQERRTALISAAVTGQIDVRAILQ